MYFWIYLYLIEHLLVLQRAIQFPNQYWSKVNRLYYPIVEFYFQNVWAYDLETDYTIDRMIHSFTPPHHRSGAIL